MTEADPLVTCPTCQGRGMIRESEAPAARRSRSMRESIARRKAEGRRVGRGAAPDRAPRDTGHYYDAWQPGGNRRGDQPEAGDQAHERQRQARKNARKYTRAELQRIAGQAGIPSFMDMNRDQLAAAIWQRNIILPRKP